MTHAYVRVKEGGEPGRDLKILRPDGTPSQGAREESRAASAAGKMFCVTDESVELIGGHEKLPIVIADYDPAWPERFETERTKIKAALGPQAVRIEHVGSTSVPGLAAKPIVDIQLSVPDVDDEDSYLPSLEAAGYTLRVREPEHRLVRIYEEVQVHVCSSGSNWERRHILFRDWLRQSSHDRAAYEAHKRELARENWETRNHYADAKSEVIAQIMERAERWADQTNWSLE
jgi:GrpB-like predicted nucleotidyltransferase (UPF0157 family)